MTSHQKKIAKKVQPKKGNTTKKSISHQEIDEGIFDFLSPSSMTPQQKAVVKQFTANFVGNVVGAIDREIKAGKVTTTPAPATSGQSSPPAPGQSSPPAPGQSSPPASGQSSPPARGQLSGARIEPTISSTTPVTETRARYERLNMLFESIVAEQTAEAGGQPAAAGGQMSIETYLNKVFLPFYLKKKNIPNDTKPAVEKLTKIVGADWGKTLGRKGKEALEQLAGIVYNMVYLGTLDSDKPADSQPAAAGGQPAAAGSQPAAAGGQPAGSGNSLNTNLYSQLETSIESNWDKLTRQQKRTIKSRVAGLS